MSDITAANNYLSTLLYLHDCVVKDEFANGSEHETDPGTSRLPDRSFKKVFKTKPQRMERNGTTQ